MHAKSAFEVKSWDEKTYNEVDNRLKLTRSSVAFAYHGELEGEGAMEYLMMYRDDSSASIVGLERVTARLAGRTGTFVLEHHGSYTDGTADGEFSVVRGSGTGELESLRGQGRSVARRDGTTSLELDYELG